MQNALDLDLTKTDRVVVVPTLNEEKTIRRCVESLLDQTDTGLTIVVTDGGSRDATRAIVRGMMKHESRLHLVDNPGVIQSIGVNMAARHAMAQRVKWLIRADAHMVYSPNFVESLILAAKQTGASAVVVSMRAVGESCFQKAAAAAQNSRLGNGGAAHRRAYSSQFVDHGHHALFDLERFCLIGGYDEAFSHNEDFEFDIRMRKAGGTIWLTASATIDYVPRPSPRALAVQYFRHGKGRARTIAKHAVRPKLRQVLPIVALLCNCLGIAMSPWIPALALLAAAYCTVCLSWGAILGLHDRDLCSVASGVPAAIMHHSWALGLCVGLVIHLNSQAHGTGCSKKAVMVNGRRSPE